MSKVIAVCNQKGGVGKTTSVVNLGASIAVSEKKVLLIDMDPQANASQSFGYGKKQKRGVYEALSETEGEIKKSDIISCIRPTEVSFLEIMPCSQSLAGLEAELSTLTNKENRLKMVVDTIVDDYDYILIDSPPSLSLITMNVFAASHSILVPVQCEFYALAGIVELINVIKLAQKHFNPTLDVEGVFLTMYDARLNLSKQVIESVHKSFPGRVYETLIPRSVRLAEAPSFGKPILLYDGMSVGSQAYLSLAKEILSYE